MLQMKPHYETEFKNKIVRLHLEEGRTLKGLAEEYSVSKANISNWVRQFREECQINKEAQDDYDYMKENLRLRKELTEFQKENEFLKKRRHSLRRKSIRGLSIYSTVRQPFWCPLVTQTFGNISKRILQILKIASLITTKKD